MHTSSSERMDRAAVRRQRVIGALVGSVVGDALGAPFEFGAPDRYSRRFPKPALGVSSEMCGGNGWRPGEWTDDTQMALLVAASLLERGGLDEAHLFHRFQDWVGAGPRDVGTQTRQVLTSGRGWRDAAHDHFAAGHPAAGNGSLMRTTPAALYFARTGAAATADAARRISDLTHGDPAAGEGCAVFHRLVASAVDGHDPLPELETALDDMPDQHRKKWRQVLRADWTPDQATEPNGAVWPTLGTAVWALRRYRSFDSALREVIDLGGDTDTVAAVTGGLLGAVHGIQAIPSRWTSAVTGELPGHQPVATDLVQLQALALQLDGETVEPPRPQLSRGIDPVEVEPGLWLSDLPGAVRAPDDVVVISLCRTYGLITREHRRQVYLTDDANNLDLDTVLSDVLDSIAALHDDGLGVLVHCDGGASRTGLVLRAWLRRTRGLTADQAIDEACRLWPHTGTWNKSFDAAVAHVDPKS